MRDDKGGFLFPESPGSDRPWRPSQEELDSALTDACRGAGIEPISWEQLECYGRRRCLINAIADFLGKPPESMMSALEADTEVFGHGTLVDFRDAVREKLARRKLPRRSAHRIRELLKAIEAEIEWAMSQEIMEMEAEDNRLLDTDPDYIDGFLKDPDFVASCPAEELAVLSARRDALRAANN